jgi:glycosyltransferase involved in cell wall biosynthesis
MVSIIIPYKNPLPYFEDCLKSIVNQSYKKLQIILVNDHSTDDSEKLALKYSIEDSRIELINNIGSGIVDALNTGSEIAKGKFITRMDADDIMSENKIEILRSLLKKKKTKHIAVGSVKYFASKKPMGDGYLKYANWLNELTYNEKNFKEIYKECTIPSCGWMMHRSDFEDIKGFKKLNYPEDYDFLFRVYYNQIKLTATKEIIHLWRDHPMRTSRNSKDYLFENFIPLKIRYLIENELKPKEEMVLWGSGKKGKLVAKKLIKNNCSFTWISNNPKKIGFEIYQQKIQSTSLLKKEKKKLVICSISSKDFKTPENSKYNRFLSFY